MTHSSEVESREYHRVDHDRCVDSVKENDGKRHQCNSDRNHSRRPDRRARSMLRHDKADTGKKKKKTGHWSHRQAAPNPHGQIIPSDYPGDKPERSEERHNHSEYSRKKCEEANYPAVFASRYRRKIHLPYLTSPVFP